MTGASPGLLRLQRGLAFAPTLWLAAGAAILLAVLYGVWQDRQRLAAERDAWSAAWEEQAAETRRQRQYARAAEVAAQSAQASADRARASSSRHRQDLARIARQEDAEDDPDPCQPYLVARRCAAVADSLREHAARLRGAPVPVPAAEPDSGGADPAAPAGGL